MRYFMLNKPRGLLSACRDANVETVMSCFDESERNGLFHVGRLDKDTEGLLLFTDDGALCKYLLSPKSNVTKTYYFIALGTLDERNVQNLKEGININQADKDSLTCPAKLEILSEQPLSKYAHLLNANDFKKQRARLTQPTVRGLLTVTEGKKHQVRRMIKNQGAYIFYLKRISIGGVPLDESLKVGEYRALTEDEIQKLKENM